MIGEWAEGRGLMGLMGRGEPGKGKIIWNVNKEYRKKQNKTVISTLNPQNAKSVFIKSDQGAEDKNGYKKLIISLILLKQESQLVLVRLLLSLLPDLKKSLAHLLRVCFT